MWNLCKKHHFLSILYIHNGRILQKAIDQGRKTKGEKKAEFATILSNLISSGGGNQSAPKCSGNETNSGAMKLKELIKNVSACSTNIHMACNTSLPKSPNATEIEKCDKAYEEW